MKAITAFLLVMFLCAGCREETTSVHREQTNSSANRKSDERALAIEQEMSKMPQKLDGKGNSAEEWGHDIAYAIRTNDDPVARRRLSNLYVNKLEQMRVLDGAPSDWAKRLYNYRHVLMSVDSLQRELDDAEVPFKLMLYCIRQYDDAIKRVRSLEPTEATGSKTWHGSTTKLARELQDDFMVFSGFLKNLYMPTAAKLRLTEDRYEFWMKEIGKALDIQGQTNATANLPTGK